jgi:hypothetical protein
MTRMGHNLGSLTRHLLGAIVPGGGAGVLNTPTLYNISALGATPVVLGFDWVAPTGDMVTGYRGQLQIDGNADFSSPEQDIIFFLDGDSVARLSKVTGLNDPSGAYNAQLRILRDNENGATTVTSGGITATYDASNWSLPFSDTIVTSVAVLANVTGANKSRYVNVANPYHQAISNADVGASCCVRGSLAMVPAKGHFEYVIDGLKATNGVVAVGLTDAANQDFNSSGFNNLAGSGTIPGVTVRIVPGVATVDIYRNGGVSAGVAIPAAPAAGDAVIYEVDKAANTVAIYWYRASTTSSTLLTTITMTGGSIPAAIWAYGSTARGTGLLTTFGTSDAFTFNGGYATFLRSPSTGFNFYG